MIGKKLLLVAIIVLTTLLVFLFLTHTSSWFTNLFKWLSPPKSDLYKDKTVLFYGEGCDHCVKVEDFIKANKIEEKIELVRLEVFNNSSNTNILADKAQICGLDYRQLGVPFLWEGKSKKCIIGNVDIIDFFQKEIIDKKG